MRYGKDLAINLGRYVTKFLCLQGLDADLEQRKRLQQATMEQDRQRREEQLQQQATQERQARQERQEERQERELSTPPTPTPNFSPKPPGMR